VDVTGWLVEGDPDAAREAVNATLGSVARRFAAAALETVAQDETLALSLTQP
jgi:hypothetical protein